jgi:hypothetical protein
VKSGQEKKKVNLIISQTSSLKNNDQEHTNFQPGKNNDFLRRYFPYNISMPEQQDMYPLTPIA